MDRVKSIKNFSLIKNIFLAFLATLVLAISAKIKIPFYPVPMTMQTFVVLLIGVYFGWRLGMFTVGLYLVEGMFLIAVFLAGFFKFENAFFKNFLKLVLSVSFIYLFGMLWLSKFTGWEKAFLLGAQPFILAELFKILILAILVPKILKLKNS